VREDAQAAPWHLIPIGNVIGGCPEAFNFQFSGRGHDAMGPVLVGRLARTSTAGGAPRLLVANLRRQCVATGSSQREKRCATRRPEKKDNDPSADGIFGDTANVGIPILADFLAVKPGFKSAHAAASHTVKSQTKAATREVQVHLHKYVGRPRRDQQMQRPSQEPSTTRERRLVVVALQPAETLGQVHSETPPRTPVHGVPLRTAGQVPQLFNESYAAYMEKQGGATQQKDNEDSDENEDIEQKITPPSLKNMRLQVQPWHRGELLKILCRAVLTHFLQDRRAAMGLRPGQYPLYFWERQVAEEVSKEGDVEKLVKYLAESQLHMEQGVQRERMPPGRSYPDSMKKRLLDERSDLSNAQQVKRHRLQEDQVLRVFLDGGMSWPTVRGLLEAFPNP